MGTAFYADLHVHSKFARATSRDLDLEHLAAEARRKGVLVVGTGDFTHPAQWEEITSKLVPAEPGLFRLRPEIERQVERLGTVPDSRVARFLLQVEISTIYKKDGATRKVHHLLYAPDMASASRIRERLGRLGNIESDGRPILGLDSRDLLEITLEAGSHCYLVPAHIWTPWFAVLGSKSGFDSIEACYGDLTREIFAVETGLSSDPPMNRLLSALDRFTLVSNSDAHSPAKVGREACRFECELDYFAMETALRTRNGWAGTVEFFVEEGKYHLDGHRKCGVRLSPEETRTHEGRCPVCSRPLTVGTLHRVQELADRSEPPRPSGGPALQSRSLLGLDQVLSQVVGYGPRSLAVSRRRDDLLARLGTELHVLQDAPLEDIRQAASPLVAEALSRMRRGDVRREAGYDGEFGTIRLFEDGELEPER